MSYLTRKKFLLVNSLLLFILCGTIVTCAMIGSVPIRLSRALHPSTLEDPDYVILIRTRIPRILQGAAVGGTLAIAGAVLQALLRNPLACPHILGISGGASLGGIGALILGSALVRGSGWLFFSLVPLASFAGALLATFLVYRIAQVHGRLQPYTLLLTGVILNAFCGAAIMLINSLVDFYQAHGILFWLMGSLATRDYKMVLALILYTCTGGLWLVLQGRRLNLLSLGEESAAQLGVKVETLRRKTFLASSLLVGAVVSVSGMIGFVGLLVPHLLRLMVGSDHRLLLPASFLGGGIFLIWADTLARTALSPTELPVGVVTALCGAPFFVYLLRREGRRHLALSPDLNA